MPAISSSAPGKIILFGEHAVVYERPAIAVPLPQLRAKVFILANPMGKRGEILLEAPDIGLVSPLDALDSSSPLALLMRLIQEELCLSAFPSFRLKITSTIPIAAGLGSGTAVSVACIRAVSTFLGKPFPPETVSSLAYEVEKVYHGTPSGIDNTVITYEKPVFFRRGYPFELIRVASPVYLIVADSGVKSETALAVSGVRQRRAENPFQFELLFDEIAKISAHSRLLMEQGNIDELGPLMVQNHDLLKKIGVSSSILDHLIDTALHSGAIGAKLSGAGMGGNMIALVKPENSEEISRSLVRAGAVRTISVTIPADMGL